MRHLHVLYCMLHLARRINAAFIMAVFCMLDVYAAGQNSRSTAATHLEARGMLTAQHRAGHAARNVRWVAQQRISRLMMCSADSIRLEKAISDTHAGDRPHGEILHQYQVRRYVMPGWRAARGAEPGYERQAARPFQAGALACMASMRKRRININAAAAHAVDCGHAPPLRPLERCTTGAHAGVVGHAWARKSFRRGLAGRCCCRRH